MFGFAAFGQVAFGQGLVIGGGEPKVLDLFATVGVDLELFASHQTALDLLASYTEARDLFGTTDDE